MAPIEIRCGVKKANSSLKKCPEFGVSLKKCFDSVYDDPNLLLICTFNENKHFFS